MNDSTLQPPTIVAHRGLHHRHPENSMAAFHAAWASGIAWCECDVHHSADGRWFVLHDPTLDRTTVGRGPIEAHDANHLAGLNLRMADGAVSAERLLLVEELISAIPLHGRLLLEIKPRGGEEVLARLWPLLSDAVVVQSFHTDVVSFAARAGRQVALLTEEADILRHPSAIAADWIHARHDLIDRTMADRCRAAGKSMGAWTVNDEPDLLRLLPLGVHMVISDEPLALRACLQRTAGDVGRES